MSRKHLKRIVAGTVLGCMLFTSTGYAAEAKETGEAVKETVETYQLEPGYVLARRWQLPTAYAGGQVARGSYIGILGNKDFMDTPFSTTSYTAQNIADKQARSLYDVLMDDSTVRFQYSAGSFMENMNIRNFSYNTANMTMNGMMGMSPYGSIPVEMFERVEVHRGPVSFLSGINPGGEVSGVINLVTKHAGSEPITRMTIDYMPDSQLGGHIDIGRRFGKDKEFGIRFNGVFRDGRTAIDGQDQERRLAALGLDYTKGRLNMMLDAYYDKDKSDGGGPFVVQFGGAMNRVPNAPTAKSIKGLYGQMVNKAIQFRTNYSLSDNTTAFIGIGKSRAEYSGFYAGADITGINNAGIGTLSLGNSLGYLERTSYEAGIRSMFYTGKVKHELVVGASKLLLTGGNASNSRTFTGTSIYDPFFDLTQLPNTPGYAPKNQEHKFSSIAIADTMSFDSEKIQLTIGARKQNVHTRQFAATGAIQLKYDKSATTPMVGLVVKPWGDKVSLYANYIQGLTRGQIVPDNVLYVNRNQVFAPQKTEQYEAGVKFDSGKFANTISIYQIKQPTVTAQAVAGGSMMAYDGRQRNRGIEWSSFGEIGSGLKLLGGISYGRAELIKTNNAVNQGHTTAGAPLWQANLGVDWDTSWDKDLTLSMRMVHTGTSWMNNANSMKMPSWTRFDLGARYKSNINKVPVTFRFAVENVFDKEYWAGIRNAGASVWSVGSGRTFKLSATFDI